MIKTRRRRKIHSGAFTGPKKLVYQFGNPNYVAKFKKTDGKNSYSIKSLTRMCLNVLQLKVWIIDLTYSSTYFPNLFYLVQYIVCIK